MAESAAGIVARLQGCKPSALAEKRHRRYLLDPLHSWHIKIEEWMLEQAGIDYNREQYQRSLHADEERYNVYTLTYINEIIMNLLIAKWGNSLALRLPADYVRRIGVKEGDQIQASLTIDGGICLRATRWDRQAFSRELEKSRADMPMTESVMDKLRREARY